MANLRQRRSSLSELQNELNQLFSSDWFSGDRYTPSTVSSEWVTDWVPAIDIKENDQSYVISADVPGVKPEDIDVHFENGMLTLKGEKSFTKEDKTEDYVRTERSRGSFMRRFSLPDVIDGDAISAKCEHGVLEITVPKSTRGGAKKITVNG